MWKDIIDRITTRDLMALELSTALVTLTFVLAMRAPDSDAFKVLLGAMLSTGFSSAIGFYFNTSKGSEDKNKVLETATTALASSTPASPVVTTTTTEAPTGGTVRTVTEPAAPAQPPSN